MTPSVVRNGLSRRISSGLMISMPKPIALEYPWMYLNQASSRSLVASRMPPEACQLTYWPVIASSLGYSSLL